MIESASQHALLFADIAGSTKLYEEHGDAIARAAIAECVSVLTEVTTRFGGEVVKTLGDEVMCVFPDARSTVIAANEMQTAVRAAGRTGRFVTGPMHVKIGTHLGAAERTETDVLGEASIIARQVVALAKADQILASSEVVEALPDELRAGSRYTDTVSAEGRPGDLVVMELIWEVTGLTQIRDTRPARRNAARRLRLARGTETWDLGPGDLPCSLGRVASNDVVVRTDLTSRSHAEISYRGGTFHISDNSSNGTVLIGSGGKLVSLRRESHPLRGNGRICLGGSPQSNPGGVIEFECN